MILWMTNGAWKAVDGQVTPRDLCAEWEYALMACVFLAIFLYMCGFRRLSSWCVCASLILLVGIGAVRRIANAHERAVMLTVVCVLLQIVTVVGIVAYLRR